MITAAFIFKSRLMNMAAVVLNIPPRKGLKDPHKTRLKPHKVIRVAKGTIKILAKIVTGEIMWKL